MGTDRADHEPKDVSKARSDGFEAAWSSQESGAPLPSRARSLLALQSSTGNRAIAGLLQRSREQSWHAEPEPVRRRNDTGLPDGLKAGVEALSGVSLDRVRVHRNSDQPAQLNALAYAEGTDIHVAPGQERHLPHEAWHVAQQAQGRVKPTAQLKRASLNDDEQLEREADVMGAMALGPAAQLENRPEAREPATEQSTPTIQRKYELGGEANVKAVGNDHRAKKVRAENIKGRTLGAAANSPRVEPFGWDQLKAAGHTLANRGGASSHYNAVRAHLMNGRLGGPGDEKWNLAPAPAQVNSQMSAGPETQAKMLVDAGHSVWLETTVSYRNNSTNANDFTSVVPNHILMEWGVMGHTGTSWSMNIDLPVAALQGAEAQEYKDWDSAKAAELVNKLKGESNQVRAQAFDLVSHINLKFEILKAFPEVYLSMERLTKGQILGLLDDKQRLELLTLLGVVTSPDQLVEQAILPLAEAGHTPEAQKLFAGLSVPDQRAMLISWKNELLAHLGALGDAWSKRDYTIFKYNGPVSRAAITNSMVGASELNAFLEKLTGPQRVEILDEWAEFTFMGSDRDARNNQVSKHPNIKPKYRSEYAKWVGAQNVAAAYTSKRPKRDLKSKKSPGKPKRPHHDFKKRRGT